MIAILPPYRPGVPIGRIRVALVLALLLALCVMKIQIDQRARETTVREFQSSKRVILASIESAVERRDLDTVLRMDRKYSGCVDDRTYQKSIHEALVTLESHETVVELAIARLLDLERHGEELSVRPNLMKPQVSNDRSAARLSVLPH